MPPPPTRRGPIVLSQEELESMMDRVLNRAFVRIGIAQSDDGEALELQRDFSYLRDLRLGSQAIRNKGVLAVLGVILAVFGVLIYFGIQFFVEHPGAHIP